MKIKLEYAQALAHIRDMKNKSIVSVKVIIGRTSAQATVEASEEQAAWLRSHELFVWRESYRGHAGIKTPLGFLRGSITTVNPIVDILPSPR